MDKSFFELNIQENVLARIKEIIDRKENCNCEYNVRGNSVWFQCFDRDTELRLLTLGDYSMTISRVAFENKRCGTMTEILDVLLDVCRQQRIKKFVVQSVCTPEMASFCVKHNLKPDPTASMQMDGYVCGDYVLVLSK